MSPPNIQEAERTESPLSTVDSEIENRADDLKHVACSGCYPRMDIHPAFYLCGKLRKPRPFQPGFIVTCPMCAELFPSHFYLNSLGKHRCRLTNNSS